MHDGKLRDAAQMAAGGWTELIVLAGALMVGSAMGEYTRLGGAFVPYLRQNLPMLVATLVIAARALRWPPRLDWSTLGGLALVVGLIGFSWIYSISA